MMFYERVKNASSMEEGVSRGCEFDEARYE